MSFDDETNRLLDRIAIHKANLNHHLNQAVKNGETNASTTLINSIDGEVKAIRNIEASLCELNKEPPNPTIKFLTSTFPEWLRKRYESENEPSLPSSTSPRLLPRERVDFVIIVPSKERNLLLDSLPSPEKRVLLGDTLLTYYVVIMPFTRNTGEVGVYNILVLPLDSDSSKTKQSLDQTVKYWHPSYTLLIGTVAGVGAKDVSIGDVILSGEVVTEARVKARTLTFETQGGELPARVDEFNNTSWATKIRSKLRPGDSSSDPNSHKGLIVCGVPEKYKSQLEQNVEIWSRVFGVKTEDVGVVKAVLQSSDDDFWAINGVSVLLGGQEEARSRSYALAAAAAYTVALLESGPIDPVIPLQPLPPKPQATKPKASIIRASWWKYSPIPVAIVLVFLLLISPLRGIIGPTLQATPTPASGIGMGTTSPPSVTSTAKTGTPVADTATAEPSEPTATLFIPTQVPAAFTLNRIKKTKTIRAIIRADSSQLSYIDDNNERVGYEIDIIEDIVRRLEVIMNIKEIKIDYKPALTNQRIPFLINQDEGDMIIAALSVTPNREKQMDFVARYFNDGLRFLARNDTSAESICSFNKDESIGVIKGSTAIDELKKIESCGFNFKTKMREFDNVKDAIAALEKKQIEAVTTDSVLLERYDRDYDFKFVLNTYGPVYDYGIAVRKGDTEFANLIKQAFTVVVECTFDGISKRYFPGDAPFGVLLPGDRQDCPDDIGSNTTPGPDGTPIISAAITLPTVHHVKAGDWLSEIAKTYYGTYNLACINLILNDPVNSGRIPNIDSLRPGIDIHIPAKSGDCS